MSLTAIRHCSAVPASGWAAQGRRAAVAA